MKFQVVVVLVCLLGAYATLDKKSENELKQIEDTVAEWQSGHKAGRPELDLVLEQLANLHNKIKNQIDAALDEADSGEDTAKLLRQKASQLKSNMPLIEALQKIVEKLREGQDVERNSETHPHKSCNEVKRLFPDSENGIYWIYGHGEKNQPVQVHCDMKRDGGGWFLALKSWYQAPSIYRSSGAVGGVRDGLTLKGTAYKLADEDIRRLIGDTNNFDLLGDQAGYNSGYSDGNYEYVIVRDFTATWDYSKSMSGSSTPPKFQSYRARDAALAWTGRLQCGTGGAGINCYTVVENNPQGGAGCQINMGKRSSPGWHHLYMANTNTDSYLYICNGAQHSSSHAMNHRWWIRPRN